jgi:hypothetical protein
MMFGVMMVMSLRFESSGMLCYLVALRVSDFSKDRNAIIFRVSLFGWLDPEEKAL